MHAWRRYRVWSFLDVDVGWLVLHVSPSTRMNMSQRVQQVRVPAGLCEDSEHRGSGEAKYSVAWKNAAALILVV